MPKRTRRKTRRLRDYFIPHKRNGHIPYALRHKALFGYSLALILLKVLVVVVSVVLPSSFAFSSAITRANIIELTNATRSSLGLTAVEEDVLLNAAAQAKANDMLAAQYFSHKSPTGKTPWDWIRGAGYLYQVAGENLAVHFSEAEDVTQGWLASPTHRANIVNARYQHIGIGIARGTYEGFESTFVVQMFGTPIEPVAPDSAAAPVEPTPEPPEPPPAVPVETVVITPTEHEYTISLEAPAAEAVRVSVGTHTESLLAPIAPETTWTGSVAIESATIGQQGLPMYVETRDAEGNTSSEPLAWVAPSSAPSELYAFSAKAEPEIKLLGVVDVPNLDNIAGRIYFLTILLISAALLVSIVTKVEHHRHTVTAHALVVIVLAATLATV